MILQYELLSKKMYEWGEFYFMGNNCYRIYPYDPDNTKEPIIINKNDFDNFIDNEAKIFNIDAEYVEVLKNSFVEERITKGNKKYYDENGIMYLNHIDKCYENGYLILSDNEIKRMPFNLKKMFILLGSKDNIITFLNDPNFIIRKFMVEHSKHDFKFLLVNDKNESVRSAIAEKGTDKHRDLLLDDESLLVLCKIIIHGNDKQKNYLLSKAFYGNVYNMVLCDYLIMYGDDEHREKLLNVKDIHAKKLLVKFGNKDIIEKLKSQNIKELNEAIDRWEKLDEIEKEENKKLFLD